MGYYHLNGIGHDKHIKTVSGRRKHQLKCVMYKTNNREKKKDYEKIGGKFSHNHKDCIVTNNHVVSREGRKKNHLSCEHCEKQFLYQSKLERHILSHKV